MMPSVLRSLGTKPGRTLSITDWHTLIDQAGTNAAVLGAAPYIEEGVWLQGNESSGAILRGIDPEFEARVSEVQDKMVAGQLTDLRPGEYGIVLGISLASRLRVGPGERIVVETEDAFSGQIRTNRDRRDKATMPYSNPQTGPIAVGSGVLPLRRCRNPHSRPEDRSRAPRDGRLGGSGRGARSCSRTARPKGMRTRTGASGS